MKQVTLDDFLPKRVIDHRQQLPPPRDMLLKVRLGSKVVTMRSADQGQTYLGSSGTEGVLLVLRKGGRRWVARFEERATGNSWAGEAKATENAAVASLRRSAMHLGKAWG